MCYLHLRKLITPFTILLIALVLPQIAWANEKEDPAPDRRPNSIFNLFKQEVVREVTIKTDLGNIIDNKRTNDKYQKAEFIYTNYEGVEEVRKIKIKPRGRSRRKFCDFPPIKLKFKKDDLAIEGLDTTANTLKLVTHCFEDQEGQEQLLKEYLAYKLYNVITPQSFKVHLMKVNYVGTQSDKHNTIQYGIVIESNKEMASRLKGKQYEKYNLNYSQMTSSNYQSVALFQYMIGNTDWSIPLYRNIKLVKQSDGKFLAVPYDFDLTGMVAPSYGKPNPDFPEMKTIKDRHYLGPCEEIVDLAPTIAVFQDKKEQILATINTFKVLPKKDLREIKNYILEFYDVIENPTSVRTEFLKACEQ